MVWTVHISTFSLWSGCLTSYSGKYSFAEHDTVCATSYQAAKKTLLFWRDKHAVIIHQVAICLSCPTPSAIINKQLRQTLLLVWLKGWAGTPGGPKVLPAPIPRVLCITQVWSSFCRAHKFFNYTLALAAVWLGGPHFLGAWFPCNDLIKCRGVKGRHLSIRFQWGGHVKWTSRAGGGLARWSRWRHGHIQLEAIRGFWSWPQALPQGGWTPPISHSAVPPGRNLPGPRDAGEGWEWAWRIWWILSRHMLLIEHLGQGLFMMPRLWTCPGVL